MEQWYLRSSEAIRVCTAKTAANEPLSFIVSTERFASCANGTADCVRMLAFGLLMLASVYQVDETAALQPNRLRGQG